MMERRTLDLFREQAFRRIGYTVGLWDLRRFSDVCEIFEGRGGLSLPDLVARVRRGFDLQAGDAEGKVNAARALGLLVSVGNRYGLAAYGRALLAVKKAHGADSAALRGLLLRIVVQRDGEMTLPLFLAMAAGGTGISTEDAFLAAVDLLLLHKRKEYGRVITSPYIRKELPRLLTIRETPQVQGPFRRWRPKPSRYTCIEIPESRIEHYKRHTVNPRTSWLRDLGLLSPRRGETTATIAGEHLRTFLGANGLLRDTFILLDPDDDVLRPIAGVNRIVCPQPVNSQLFAELLSHVYAGRPTVRTPMDVDEFWDRLRDAYGHTKLESFRQAEVLALQLAIEAPLAAGGQSIDFPALLNELATRFPERVYRMSSRRSAGSYLALKNS